MAQDKFALAKQVCTLLEEELAASGFELLDVRVFRGGGRLQLRIYLDTPEGIDLDGCARASRTIDMLLEEADLIAERYVIEVSSPGIRRPLRKPEHFAACQGCKVELQAGDAGRPRKVRGELVSAGPDGIVVLSTPFPGTSAAGEQVTLAYGEILEANLDADFDPGALIRADRRQRKDERRAARQQRKQTKPRHHRS